MKFSIKIGPNGKIKKLAGTLPISFIKEGSHMIAYCPALNLTSYGANISQAKKRFREALFIFFEELVEMGTLEEVLYENGWQKVSDSKNTPTWMPPVIQNENFNVTSASC